MMPANEGAPADVPPTPTSPVAPRWPEQDRCMQIRDGSCSPAVKETSGRSRAPSLGMPRTPDCHDGLGKSWLGPPPPAESGCWFGAQFAGEQLSFQTLSGM